MLKFIEDHPLLTASVLLGGIVVGVVVANNSKAQASLPSGGGSTLQPGHRYNLSFSCDTPQLAQAAGFPTDSNTAQQMFTTIQAGLGQATLVSANANNNSVTFVFDYKGAIRVMPMNPPPSGCSMQLSDIGPSP